MKGMKLLETEIPPDVVKAVEGCEDEVSGYWAQGDSPFRLPITEKLFNLQLSNFLQLPSIVFLRNGVRRACR